MFYSVNPYSKVTVFEHPFVDEKELENSINDLSRSFLEWRKFSIKDRQNVVHTLGKLLRESVNELAELVTNEMGKPVEEAKGEVLKCADLCDFYSTQDFSSLVRQEIKTHFSKSEVVAHPLGVIFGVMPWNFPVWQVLRFAIPTILIGNVVLVKPAPNVGLTSQFIGKLFNKSHKDLLKMIFIDLPLVEKVVSDNRVRGVSLTGSVSAGRSLAQLAGKYLKPSVMELGGSDPYIILDDIDISKVSKICAQARLLNCGQTCISAKRFIVSESISPQFIKALIEEFNKRKMGNPLEKDVQIGPMARQDLKDKIESQVNESVERGAQVLFTSKMEQDKGFFFPPTILGNIPKDSPAANEELFGPVATIYTFKDRDEAVKIANLTAYGLGAAVFTNNLKEHYDFFVQEMDTGQVFFNDFVKSAPQLPFGGIKDSGYGRELSSYGLLEFANIKTVCTL